MAVRVPTAAESRVSGLERARIGAAAADRLQDGVRGSSLERARSIALDDIATPEGLAEWCTLAAGNIDYSAKVLLEAMGQGARGVLRTKAWVLRNGARVNKSERGYAVSMFGAYVFEARQWSERFGSPGTESGDAPTDELDGWATICSGDRVAAAIICAMRGYRLPPLEGLDVDLEALDLALARVRGVAWHLPACLSCDGAGCVLCSCSDDRCRLAVVDCKPMSAAPKPKAPRAETGKRIGRPPKARPALGDLAAVAAAMREARRLRAESDRLRSEAQAVEARAMRLAHETHSLGDIAAATGLSRQRVHQIIQP